MGLTRLLTASLPEILIAVPPAATCIGLVAGFVYEKVIISPYFIALERVNCTLAPEIATELTVLAAAFTVQKMPKQQEQYLQESYYTSFTKLRVPHFLQKHLHKPGMVNTVLF